MREGDSRGLAILLDVIDLTFGEAQRIPSGGSPGFHVSRKGSLSPFPIFRASVYYAPLSLSLSLVFSILTCDRKLQGIRQRSRSSAQLEFSGFTCANRTHPIYLASVDRTRRVENRRKTTLTAVIVNLLAMISRNRSRAFSAGALRLLLLLL